MEFAAVEFAAMRSKSAQGKPLWCVAALLIVSGWLLQGCQSAPDIRADYDKSADFAKYRTFGFVDRPGTDQAGYSSIVTQDIEAAISAEMEKRGYTRSENPDLLINFSGKLQKMQDIRSSPSAGPYYGYRGYGAWGGYNEVYTVNYTEGTLNVDVVDAKKKQMVWGGVGVGEVTKQHMQDRQAALQKAVADIFVKYPFRAGEGVPIKTAEK